MNSFLLNRQLGAISPRSLAQAQNARLLGNLQPALDQFVLEASDGRASNGELKAKALAHAAGVASIAIDSFEGRYLISGGADSSLAIWDLEAGQGDPLVHVPLAVSPRTSTNLSLGITHVSFYPFDSLALLTSGYDATLKLFSSETLEASASFDLGSIVYSHATSDIASHLLVACASQHPAVRLIDLKSGSATHSLSGHAGSTLSVAWHPRDEHVLASGATDGVVRLWDVRRSASSLGVLDMEDSIGIPGYDGRGTGARRRGKGRSHNGAVNGLSWTEDGKCLLSNGQDERMRIWDMRTGANTLVNFGPGLKNSTITAWNPLIAPSHLSPAGKEVVFYPNPKEILSFDLYTGNLESRLRIRGLPGSQNDASSRTPKSRATSLTWRAHNVELYSAHGDGTIRCWKPHVLEDILTEREDSSDHPETDASAAEKKRKREEFDDIVKNLTTKKLTFT
ncbi:hypothetical protein AC578_840 [Pseudocercospora eumusae]|uniref:Uncharacterized protein n=1 Tax=Pseudocercospora eumusae TaxID=321146 RepID=A0A139GZY5_9PEZI|nr:hypothetical protein AC578_840 [Pseudocercospora eumusae]